jgi:hypothetical protein
LSRKRRQVRAEAAQVTSESLESRLLLTSTFINAGGPGIAGDIAFVQDDAFQNGVGRSFRRNDAIDMSGVDSSLPQSVFQSVLWDGRGRSELQFDIPTTPGSEYQVDLLFSEIWRGGFDVGRRVFDVSLEGSVVLDNFDIYSEAGARTALVKSFDITATDSNLDIDFAHVSNNPAIAGIIVREIGGGDGPVNVPPTISAIANQSVNENQTLGPLNFTVGDVDGDMVNVTATSSNPAVVPQSAVAVGGTGTSRTVTVTPATDAVGTSTVTLTASDGQASVAEQFVVTVNEVTGPVDPPPPGPGPQTQTLQLNAGGSSVGSFVSAAPFQDRVNTSNPRRPASISNVPVGVPETVFQSSIWSPARLGDLQLDIPNVSGVEYQVDLLFAETWRDAFRNGGRQFDVSLDGQQVLNDFDIFATGGRESAVVQTFTITGDGNLDINLTPVKNNPHISGVIMTRLGSPPPAGNRAPVFTAIADRSVNTNGPVSFTASATDPDGDNLTYSILTTGLPGSPSINPTLGTFNWTPPSAGVFNVTLQASDGQLTDTETFSVTVTTPPVNQAPVLAAIPAQQAAVGTQLSFTVSGTDSDGPSPLQYFVGPEAPTAVNVNSSTGVVTWTPTASDVGAVSFPVTASDGDKQVTQTATITVSNVTNSPPVLAAIGNKTVEANETLSFTATATDPNSADTLQFSLGPTAPTGAIINSATGVFSWTADPFFNGNVSFTVEVTDGQATDSEALIVSVVTGQAPTIALIADQTVEQGSLLQFTVTATDPNPNDTLTFSLVSTGLAGNPQIGATSGIFSWTPPLVDGPGAQVTVRVTDSTGLSDTESFTVVVTPTQGGNVAPVLATIPAQTASTGQQLSFTASATDADNDTLSYFRDPTAPSGATINSTSGVFQWTPTAVGTFTFPVSVTDGVATTSLDVTVTVSQGTANQAPSFGPIADQNAVINQQFQLTLSASDPENGALSYSLVTTNLPGAAAVNATTGVFTWTPSQTGPAFSVTVRVTDTGGLADTATFNVTVNNSGGGNNAPVLNAVPNQTVDAGVVLTFTAVATDADNDTLEFFLDPTAPNGASMNAATGVFTWTPSPSDAGPNSFPIFVSDGTVTVQTTVSVTVDGGPGGGGGNTAPSFGPQNDLSIAATATLTATFTADDPDAGDSLTYTLVTNLPGNPTVNPQTGVFTWTPPASAAETNFQVTIRATDLAGASDDALFTVRVLDSGPGGGGGGGGGNNAPVIETIPNQQATVGTQLTFQIVATDADNDVLDIFLDPTGPFTANISATGVFTWTPTAADIGTLMFPIFVFDGSNNVSTDVTIVVMA